MAHTTLKLNFSRNHEVWKFGKWLILSMSTFIFAWSLFLKNRFLYGLLAWMWEKDTKCEPYKGHRSQWKSITLAKFLKCCYTPGLCEPHLWHCPPPHSWHHTLVSSAILHCHFFHKQHRKVLKTLLYSLLPGNSKTVFDFSLCPSWAEGTRFKHQKTIRDLFSCCFLLSSSKRIVF
jgi:hypothetical protein